MSFLQYVHQAVDGLPLDAAQAEHAMSLILAGEATSAQLAAFLVALRMRGETVPEILGFARAMRARGTPVHAGDGPLVDTCGTGGDATGTFNVSTVSAIVAAAAGARVAKHGNRSISSKCGSADILEELGVRVSLTAEQMGDCLRDVGIAFLFAPALHPAMRHAQPARVELKLRTAFNLLGPLTNPARASSQVAGAPSLPAARLMAHVLAQLDLHHGYVVHGADGMDEITTTRESHLFEIANGRVLERTVTPEDFSVPRAQLPDLSGGDRVTNAAIARQILGGQQGPRRDIVLVNASAALTACGLAPDFQAGAEMAARAIDTGAANAKLTQLAEYSQKIPAISN